MNSSRVGAQGNTQDQQQATDALVIMQEQWVHGQHTALEPVEAAFGLSQHLTE